MKKIYLLLSLFAINCTSFAQTFPNAGFENWRTGTSGVVSAKPIQAPDQWFGFDSLIIADGETFGAVIGAGDNFHAQVFQDTSIVHSGSSSAKLITVKQDTLGLIPGGLSNALPVINIPAVIGGASLTSAVSYVGGTAVPGKVKSVSAWVRYTPGVDSLGAPAKDTGLLIVQAIGYIGGRDSVLGTGTLLIAPTNSTWVQITDSIIYTDLTDVVDTIRVNFASSGGAATTGDSSTLYVDDITMILAPEAVQTISMPTDLVKVYPNPASNTINMDCPQNTDLSCKLYSVNGQVVLSTPLSVTNELNISDLASGLYFYAITDNKGNMVQKGKVTIAK